MKLFYIGEKFYRESNTMMSPIYHENKKGKDYYRSDWGEVSLALQARDEVHIRQATDKEMLWAFNKLRECK